MNKLITSQTVEETVQDINDGTGHFIEYSPSWIRKWGIGVIVIIISILCGIAWIINYPITINAPIQLTTINPPVQLIARVDGKMGRLFVENNVKVKADEILGVLDNPTNLDDYLFVNNMIEEIEKLINSTEDMVISVVNREYSLGELQTYYENLLDYIKEYNFFYKNNYFKRSISAYQKQIDIMNFVDNTSNAQIKISEEKMKLLRKQLKRDSILYEKKYIAQSEIDNSFGIYLTELLNIQIKKGSQLQNDLQISQIKKNIIDLENDYMKTEATIKNNIYKNLEILKTQFIGWEKKYLLRSPINGTVFLRENLSKDANVSVGEILLSIIPNLDKPDPKR